MPIPNNNDFIPRDSAKSKIYQVICDWIVHGELKPGEKLNVSELADHFSVSRTPVREALLMLETQKLIEVTPGKATIVTEIDKSDLEKCYLPLAEIQGLATELACIKMTDDNFRNLEDIYTDFLKANENMDVEAAISCDSAFHKLILHIADNEYITEFSQMLIIHTERIKYHYFQFDTMRKTSVKQHREILDAIRERDSLKASSLMKYHWRYVMERSLEKVDESKI
ncbi:GntR family transcriptional regulator [Anaerocolumna sp.]|uniref:GntR family transcriptional regulator n=1 Tax=Anaerocolumna sp. TaxID=2041569 RepID=UPI0028A9572A|nr:GntR family transcriptional regulator [Anaerocolumna sp.]